VEGRLLGAVLREVVQGWVLLLLLLLLFCASPSSLQPERDVVMYVVKTYQWYHL
jgi:hypothetical protein